MVRVVRAGNEQRIASDSFRSQQPIHGIPAREVSFLEGYFD